MPPSPLRRRFLSAALIAIPLLVLVVDFARFPVVFNRCQATTAEVDLRTLVDRQVVPYGSYLGHTFYVSLDDVQDSQYLSYLHGAPTALVIGIDHDDPSPIWGGLTRKVLSKLEVVSSPDASVLWGVITSRDPDSGHLTVKHLNVPQANWHSFPVQYLYIIGIKAKAGNLESNKQSEFLQSGLKAVMAQAARDRVLNLIIPTVGVDPGDPSTLQLKDFFPLVLNETTASGRPSNVYLALNQDWDTTRGYAVDALQTSWADLCDKVNKQDLLVREDLRLVLAGIFVCLLVSAAHVPISLKNFLIITASFAGLGFGAIELLKHFVQDWNADARAGVTLAVLIVLAVLFPLLPRWNPKEIFDKGQTT